MAVNKPEVGNLVRIPAWHVDDREPTMVEVIVTQLLDSQFVWATNDKHMTGGMTMYKEGWENMEDPKIKDIANTVIGLERDDDRSQSE
ncbi:MAG: hypothetical protein ACXABY_34275 [Candidatus Thorarchaeota archaeon]|jgi:hypothetical protein